MLKTGEYIEIRNFEIRIEFSQYWIEHKKGEKGSVQYPIIMDPYNLLKLFEIEGITLTPDIMPLGTPVHFSKAVLIRNKNFFGCDLYGDDGDDSTAQPCWVKLDKEKK